MNKRSREIAMARNAIATNIITPKQGEDGSSVVRRAIGHVRAQDAARRKAARKTKRAARKANR